MLAIILCLMSFKPEKWAQVEPKAGLPGKWHVIQEIRLIPRNPYGR